MKRFVGGSGGMPPEPRADKVGTIMPKTDYLPHSHWIPTLTGCHIKNLKKIPLKLRRNQEKIFFWQGVGGGGAQFFLLYCI